MFFFRLWIFQQPKAWQSPGKDPGSLPPGSPPATKMGLAFNKYSADVMREVAVDLFKEQADTAATYLNSRSGELLQHLRSAPYNVVESDGMVSLQLRYILKVRFLDLKKTAKGKKKRNYTPIYNKLVWG